MYTNILRPVGDQNKVYKIGLPLGCSRCVLPEGYAGVEFKPANSRNVCSLCSDYKKPQFPGIDPLIEDLDLEKNEQVGVTVSGGKDSLYLWMKMVDILGPRKVVAFNHHKIGFIHPLAKKNLHRASKILGSELVQIEDADMLPRFRKNLEAFLKKPDPAMVRVAFCAGCRVGISGRIFGIGEVRGIRKFISGASYLEQIPFKSALMKIRGDGDEHKGLLCCLEENPSYRHGDNIKTLLDEDRHNHKSQLSRGKSRKLYPGISFFDFYNYEPNEPEKNEKIVTERLGWKKPSRSWRFDCLIEEFKDLFYYGLLGYSETDNYLSSLVRHGLLTRQEAIRQLNLSRHQVVDSKSEIFSLMRQLGVSHLIGTVEDFYRQSQYLRG